MRVAILGLGQIGGSVGRALVAAGDPWRVAGWTRSADARHAAAAEGIDVAGSIGEACTGADAIVLAVPPLACLELLDELAGGLRSATDRDAVITDVASTKAAICARAAGHGLRFVGGHPMAGREASGYAAADAALFAGRPWVIVPSDPPDIAAEDRVANIAATCGARIVRLGAVEHDAAVGAISHLPLVVAAALVEAVASGPGWPDARDLASTGWASMTRLARGDVEMGAGILATNGPLVAGRLRDLRDVLDRWLADLDTETPDPDRLRERFAAAKRRLEDDDPGPGR
ncbi:MAG TPA: prephenate dehydrogenase/arogenate dehydrogenase family protein [Verrucomicrobiae bacterium]|nr:prephenate dehydrogenase/arogenate dehydrogenase family protein [Verrucomicrobiae bacterium]